MPLATRYAQPSTAVTVRLMLTFPRAPRCPDCGDTLNSRVIVFQENIAFCTQCCPRRRSPGDWLTLALGTRFYGSEWTLKFGLWFWNPVNNEDQDLVSHYMRTRRQVSPDVLARLREYFGVKSDHELDIVVHEGPNKTRTRPEPLD
jgi:hypothetical protein